MPVNVLLQLKREPWIFKKSIYHCVKIKSTFLKKCLRMILWFWSNKCDSQVTTALICYCFNMLNVLKVNQSCPMISRLYFQCQFSTHSAHFFYSFIAKMKHISACWDIPILASKYVQRAEKSILCTYTSKVVYIIRTILQEC